MNGTVANGCSFTKAILNSTSLVGIIAWHARFKEAVMEKADFSYSQLPSTHFEFANAHEGNFTGSDLREVNFTRTDVTAADFTRCVLHYADYSYGIIEQTDFSEADLLWANVHGVSSRPARWTNANLSNVRRTDNEMYLAEIWKPGDPPKWS